MATPRPSDRTPLTVTVGAGRPRTMASTAFSTASHSAPGRWWNRVTWASRWLRSGGKCARRRASRRCCTGASRTAERISGAGSVPDGSASGTVDLGQEAAHGLAGAVRDLGAVGERDTLVLQLAEHVRRLLVQPEVGAQGAGAEPQLPDVEQGVARDQGAGALVEQGDVARGVPGRRDDPQPAADAERLPVGQPLADGHRRGTPAGGAPPPPAPPQRPPPRRG